MSEFLRELDMLGVPLFLLRNKAGGPIKGKWAAPAGWQKRTAEQNEAVIAGWRPGMAVGAVMGHVHDALDEDPRHGGADSLVQMARDGLIPKVRHVTETMSGGHHLFVPLTGMKNSAGLLPGIDLRTRGGFVIVPPTEGYRVLPRSEWPELGAQPDDAVDRLRALEPEDAPLREREAVRGPVTPEEAEKASNVLEKALREVRAADARNSTASPWLLALYNFVKAGVLDREEVDERMWEATQEAPGDHPYTRYEFDESRESAWGVARPERPRVDDDFDVVAGGDPLVDFWSARPELTLIHEWARARMVAPTAVLGAVLARICAATPPWVVLPPTVGKAAGLNLFVALVGPSGSGKGAADGVAQDALRLPAESAFTRIGAGSGEGIAHLFAHRTKLGVERHATSVLMSLAEIDTLVGLVLRPGSTILPELRKAWTGEDLGFAYVDPAKRLTVAEYTYRLALLAGVQPERAGALFEDESGGTPQRFVWLPAVDPTIPDEKTPEPEPIVWRKPRAWPKQVGGLGQLPVCSEATTTIEQAARDRNRGLVSALDGHALLSREKVAALLGILDGRAEVSAEDWRLAGMVMEQSDQTRTAIRAVLAKAATQAGTARATEDGRQEVIRGAVVAEDGLARACQALSRKLHREDGWVTGKDLRDVLGNRAFYQEALDSLKQTGAIKVENVGYKGQPGHRVRLAGGAS